MWIPHRRRWAIMSTVFTCTTAVTHWLLGRLSGRPLSAPEVIGVALGIAVVVAASAWALYSEQEPQNGPVEIGEPDLAGSRTEPLHLGVTEVRTDGSAGNTFLPPPSAPPTAHRLRWCGADEVLTAKRFLLREPLVYYSVSIPSDDEPSCIDLSLDAEPTGRDAEDGPSVYPTYAGLSPNQRAVYLAWLANDRTGALEHVGYAFLYLCGLERRALLERTDQDAIVKEAVRLREEYGRTRALGVHLFRFLAFSLTRPGLEMSDPQLLLAALNNPPANCKEDDLAVALAWFTERHIPLPAPWAFAIARQDARISSSAALASQRAHLESQFNTRYRERFGSGLRLSASSIDRQFQYRPVNASLEYRDQSDDAKLCWSFTIKSVKSHTIQCTPVADLLAQIVGDLPPTTSTFPASSRARDGTESTKESAPASSGAFAEIPTVVPTSAKPDTPLRGRMADESRPQFATEPSPPRWHGTGKRVSVKSYVLCDPMVYISEGTLAQDEPSCIDTSLQVGQPVVECETGRKRPASYAFLDPNQRACYLDWISNGRAGALDNSGYAFLFFYGLERRLLIEQQDQIAIVEEVVRLLDTYPFFALFDAHLNLFLAFALAQIGIESITENAFHRIFDRISLKWDENVVPLLKWDESLVAVALAWFYKNSIPLPASWAIRAARKDPLFPNSVASTIPAEQLTSLFESRYREHFDRGLILKAASDDREIRYRPVNLSLLLDSNQPHLSNRPIKIPDVLGFGGQFVPLVKMLTSCVDYLRPLNRVATTGSFVRTGPEPRTAPAANAATSPGASAPQSVPRESANLEFRVENEDQSHAVLSVHSDLCSGQIRWYGNGDTITTGIYRLCDPMVYVSGSTPSTEEASCIDLSLHVGTPVWEATGALGYYPTYAKLTPNQRANYLSWLANGRATPLADIGYAFLHFYGLERRLIIERQGLSPIVKECVRLLETYTFSGSFDGYLSRFLAFALAKSGIETLKDNWFDAVFEKSRLRRDEDFLAVALAWFFQKKAPLPVSWALRLARQDARSPRSIVLDRLPDEFNSLFEKRYREKFGDGLALKVSKRERSIVYRPASPSLLFDAGLGSRHPEPIKISNVLGIQSQFSPLVTIWSSCIEELRPVTRILAKGIEVGSREAFEALPHELRATVEHPEKAKWDSLVTEHARDDGYALVQVSKLATLYGLEARSRLTARQSRALAQTAEYMGLDIEPDTRLTTRSYSWDDVVALLRREAGAALPTDSRYHGAALMLELGIYVAASDGIVEDVEVDQVARFLESQFLLDPPDARRLEALKRVFIERPPTLAGLGKRLQSTFSREQREAVGRFLTGIAAANGIIDRKELSALRTVYRALDIGVDQLNGLLEESRRASQEPIEVERGDPSAESGEAIPARSAVSGPAGLVLDESILKRLMAETERVAAMLGEAMRDESPTDESEQPTIAWAVDPRFDALDGRFHSILATLLTRRAWQRAEFESLARACNLMPAGALDAVNTWAYDRFDDPIIIEHGQELGIQSHLVETRS
jgi:uncharacterized tellurite resistance protein B-like protein